MADSFFITIELEALCENFTKADGRVWSVQEVRQWLIDGGLTAVDGGWVAEETTLGLLAKEEYRIMRRLA